MVKTLLLKPPQTYIEGTLTGRPCIPFSLLYLAGALLDEGHEVSIRDLLIEGKDQIKSTKTKSSVVDKSYLKRGLTNKQILQVVNDEKPDLIGITCVTALQERDAKDLSNLVRENFPEIPLVAGGTNVTLTKEKLFLDSSFDYLIYGEGEKTIVSLVNSVFGNEKIEKIPGISYRINKSNIKHNFGRPKHHFDYDKLPHPRYDLINNVYDSLYDHTQIKPLTNKSLGIFFSRGCGRCNHCASGQLSYRKSSVEGVNNLFDFLESKSLTPNEVVVQDDDFFRDYAYVEEMMVFFGKKGIVWNAEGGIVIDHLIQNGRVNHGFIKKLSESGLHRAYVPVEIINLESAKSMGRPYHNLDQDLIFELFDSLTAVNIQADTAFIVGTLNEKISDIERTVEFAKNLKEHTSGYIGLFSFKVFPGFESYFRSKGYEFEILGGPQEVAFDCFNIKTKNLNPLELNILREGWYREVNGDQFKVHLAGYWPGRTSYEEFQEWKNSKN